jgi:integrase
MEERCGMTAARMVTIKLPYIVEDVDRHGNVRIYFRRHGRKMRIREPMGSDGFYRRYSELLPDIAAVREAPSHAARSNTLRWLCVQFFGSPDFNRLDQRTQYTRRGIIEAMLNEPIAPGASETFADFPIDRLTPKALRVLRDRKAGRLGAADNRVRALRGLFKWALRNEYATSNPARDVEYVGGKSDGWHSWTPEELEQFETRHAGGSKARLALALLQYTGASRIDVVKLGPSNVRDGVIQFIRAKTRVAVELPIASDLQTAIGASAVVGSETFLVTAHGKPFTVAGFGNWFRDRCNEAGLPHCSAHGVRKAAAARAAENGATTHELMAMFGWLNLRMAEHYTKAANRKRAARRAATLLKR